MKRRFILLAAFALMALMTPLGAKGQTMYFGYVYGARAFADTGFGAQFTGVINYIKDTPTGNPDGQWKFYMQDEFNSGGGIYVRADPSCGTLPDNLAVGDKIKVTVSRYNYWSGVHMTLSGTDVTVWEPNRIELISHNNTINPMTGVTLQQLKNAHYPITREHVVQDHYQDRLIELTNLKIVERISRPSYPRVFAVEDVNGVRDTIYFRGSSNPDLQVNDVIEYVRAINTRDYFVSDGIWVGLETRNTTVADFRIYPRSANILPARNYAQIEGTMGIPLDVTGIVNFARFYNGKGEIFMQTPNDQSGGYGGIRIITNFNPANRGITVGTKIKVHGTPKVFDVSHHMYNPSIIHSRTPDHIVIEAGTDDVTLLSHNNTMQASVLTLSYLKRYENLTQYEDDMTRINYLRQDQYQHRLVRVQNLTVESLLGTKSFGSNETYYYYRVRQGNDTDCLVSAVQLTIGWVIPEATVVNCRSNLSSSYASDYLCKLNSGAGSPGLLLRSFDDLNFDIKTISYARAHLDQPHHIEGVITSARQLTGWAECFIQDNTGGLCVGIPTDVPHPAVGDRVILHGTPIIEASHINSPKRYTTYIVTTGSNQTVTPVNTDIATLYQQDQNSPMNGPNEGKLITLQNLVVKEFGMGETALFNLYQNNDPSKVIVVEPSMLTEAQITNLRNSVSIGSTILSITGVKDYNSSWNYKHKIWLRSLADIQIQDPEPEPEPEPDPHNISLSLYPYNLEDLNPSPVYATLTRYGTYADRITSATPGTRVYIQAPDIENNVGIDYLEPEHYSPDVNPQGENHYLWCHWFLCSSHPELSYSYHPHHKYFIMPDHDVEFRCLYVPSSYSYSDIWQAREGAMANANDPAKLAYFSGLVTYVINSHEFIMEDRANNNAGDDELKKYNGIIVNVPNHNVQVGDRVTVEGYPNGLFEDRICVTGAVIAHHDGPSNNVIEHPYPTTLTGIYNDLHGSGQTMFNSRLQTRLVQLSGLHVDAQIDATHYTIKDMNDYRTATLIVPSGVELSVGSTIGLTALNWSAADSQDIELILRSAADITGANDITISTYAMDFDEFGSGLNSSGSAYLWINVPISIGSNLADLVEVGSANVSYTGEWIYDGTEATIQPLITTNKTTLRFCVPANTTSETRTCAIVVHAGSVYSQPLIITQTGSAPAEFTVSPTSFSFQQEDASTTQHYQSGDIMVSDISHVASPYASHMTATLNPASASSWFHLGSWDADNQRYHFTVSDNTSTEAQDRNVTVNIAMEGTDGTWVQHSVNVHQDGPDPTMTLSPDWLVTDPVPLCQELTQTFEVRYANFNTANPYRIYLEAADFNNFGEDVDIIIEPSTPVEVTDASGILYFQVTMLVKNAGSHYGTITAYADQYDGSEWQTQSLSSPETNVWVNGLHPYNIDTKATSTETLNSLGTPEWTVWDPNTYQPADTLWFIHVSIASEVLGKEAEMLVFDPDNGSYVTCNTFDPTYVSGNNLLIPLHDGTYIIKVGGDNLAWNSTDGLYGEHIQFPSYTTDLFEVPASCKWNVSFSGENAVISPSTNANYSLRMVSVMVPNPENPEEEILDYHIVCVNEGGTPLQIFYHIEGELPSPTFSDMRDYFEDGQAINVTLTPAANTSVAYCLNEDYDHFVISETPVTLTVYETTKVSAWSMLECQTGATLDGLVEHTYYKINTIAEARLNPGTEYYIHCIVSTASHGHNRCYAQDETSGVEIGIDWTIWENWYNNHDTLVSLQYGDEIVLKGWYDSNNGVFTGATWDWNTQTTYDEPEVAKLSTGNTVTPLLVTFDELYETTLIQYMARLVKLQNEQVTVSDFYPETYQLRHGTLEEPYYMEFSRYLENSDEEFPLNDGDIIDLTAVYNGGFSNPKEITVKTPRSYDMQAYTDVDLTQPNTEWDSHIWICDAYGNILNPNALYAGDKVYFTLDDGYGVGYNAYLLPVVAVFSNATGELIADTYTNFQMGVTFLGYSRDRLFSFNMPDEDVVIRVYMMNAYTLTVYNNNMTQVFENVTLYFGSVNTMGIPESWLDNYYMTAGDVATGEAINMPYTLTANTTLTSVYQHGDEKYGRVFYQDETMTNLVIERPSVVLSDVTLTLGDLTSTNAADFVIEEGGSVDILSTDMSDNRLATVRKSIVGYGDDINVKNGWYLISTPFCEEIDPASVTNMIPNTADNYDLYTFSQSNNMAEWRNYKAQGSNVMLKPMEGQLYANKTDVELSMAGNLMAAPREIVSGPAISLSYTAGNQFAGWNLVGNPFLVEAYMKNVQNYYRLQDVLEGGVWTSKLIAETGTTPLDPMQGVFVQTDQTRWLEMVKEQPVTNNNQGLLDITVSQSTERGSSTLDRAMVRFGEGGMLGKFSFRDGGTQLYIPQGSKDYAVVSTAMQGEVPVNFKASRSGSYTISVEATNAEMEYLHLIDNLTGADVDLLVEPSYTFESHTTDYASRFRLVFSSICEDADGDNETFAYYNGSEWVIANTGRATLQVVDVMGRILNSETIDGNATARINGTPGVYIMRLVNGENVKVQMVVVR